MSRSLGLVVLMGGLFHALALADGNAGCSIQNAAMAGQRVVLQCEEPQLLFSSDQGATWETVPLPYEAKVRAIQFLDARRGFMAGDDGLLLATQDGGRNWLRVSVPAKEHLTGMSWVGEQGWISGYGGVVLHSEDGGKTWTAQTTGVTQALEGIYFVDANHGWAVGWIGTIVRTSDGGKTWQTGGSTDPTMTWSLSSVYFRDDQNGWAVGFGGQILHSKDGGATWEQLKSPVQATLSAVLFDGSGRGYIAAGNSLLLSQDGGLTWQTMEIEDPIFLERLLLVNDSVWAIGEFGILTRQGSDQKWRQLALDTFAVS